MEGFGVFFFFLVVFFWLLLHGTCFLSFASLILLTASHLPQLSFLAFIGISINICSPEQSDSQAKTFLYPVFRTLLVFCLLWTTLSLSSALSPPL